MKPKTTTPRKPRSFLWTFCTALLFSLVLAATVVAAFYVGRLGMTLSDLGPVETATAPTQAIAIGYLVDRDAWVRSYDISATLIPNDRSGRFFLNLFFVQRAQLPLPAAPPIPEHLLAPDKDKKKGKKAPVAVIPAAPPLPPVKADPQTRLVLSGITVNGHSINKSISFAIPKPDKAPPVFVQYLDLGQKQPFENKVRLDRLLIESIPD